MAASANGTIRSTYFHPQHMLAAYHYSDASAYTCAACERAVTGVGYRCGECDFNIHEACFSLPQSISFAKHSQHELTLTHLRASRWCDVCKETSHAGAYMYLCGPCNYDAHPRCVAVAPQQRQGPGDPAGPADPAPAQQGGDGARRAVHAGLGLVWCGFGGSLVL